MIKKKKRDKVKNEPRKITKFNIVFIDIQLVFTFLTAGLFVWYIIDSSIIYLFQLFLGLTLLVMAYNNQIIYRKKWTTIIYSIIGIFIIILDGIMYLGA